MKQIQIGKLKIKFSKYVGFFVGFTVLSALRQVELNFGRYALNFEWVR